MCHSSSRQVAGRTLLVQAGSRLLWIAIFLIAITRSVLANDDMPMPSPSSKSTSTITEEHDPQVDKDRTVVQALMRLPNVKLDSFPSAKDSLLRHLRRNAGSAEYFRLLRKFELRDLADSLITVSCSHQDESVRVEAVRMLLDWEETERVRQVLHGEDSTSQVAMVTALGMSEHPKSMELVRPFVGSANVSPSMHRAAIMALGRHTDGANELADRIVAGEFTEDLHLTLANAIRQTRDQALWSRVVDHLQLPQASGQTQLPAIGELLEMSGDADRGAKVFRNEGTCIKCHQIGSEGKGVGPALSEIGGKLSREALFVSILDPAAAISFGFEAHIVHLHDGESLTGIVVSQTDEELTLRTAEAITRTIPRDEIEEVTRQNISIMPAGLAQNMSAQQLVDLVEYLTTLQNRNAETQVPPNSR